MSTSTSTLADETSLATRMARAIGAIQIIVHTSYGWGSPTERVAAVQEALARNGFTLDENGSPS
jgi:hypothetical protein